MIDRIKKYLKAQSPQKRIVLVVVPVIVIVALLGLFQLQSNLQFRLVSKTPSRELPTSTDTIILEFNKELQSLLDQPRDIIVLDPALNYTIKIEGKTLTLGLVDRPTDGEQLSINLAGLVSREGDVLSTQIRYQVRYVPFGNLSEQERARQTEDAGLPEDNHPLLSKLPHDEIAFRIGFSVDQETFGTADDWRGEKDNFTVTISTYALDGSPTFIEDTSAIRQRALDWIRKLGVDPDNDINIVYIPDDNELGTSGEEDFTGDGVPPEDFGTTQQETIDPSEIF